jgi:hypothetical protein
VSPRDVRITTHITRRFRLPGHGMRERVRPNRGVLGSELCHDDGCRVSGCPLVTGLIAVAWPKNIDIEYDPVRVVLHSCTRQQNTVRNMLGHESATDWPQLEIGRRQSAVAVERPRGQNLRGENWTRLAKVGVSIVQIVQVRLGDSNQGANWMPWRSASRKVGCNLHFRFVLARLASQSGVIVRLLLVAQSLCLLPVRCHVYGLCGWKGRRNNWGRGDSTPVWLFRVLFRALDGTGRTSSTKSKEKRGQAQDTEASCGNGSSKSGFP